MNGPLNPIDNLRDIHLPVEPGWWPPAPGWWVVAVLAVASAWLGGRLVHRAVRRRAPVRAFRRALADIEIDPIDDAAVRQQVLARMSILVRQLLLATQGNRAAAMTGMEFLGLLDQLSRSRDFSEGSGQILAAGPYQRQPAGDIVALKQLLLDRLGKVRITQPLDNPGLTG